MSKYQATYRGHEIVIERKEGSKRWLWLDDKAKEGFGFATRQEAIIFAQKRIDRDISSTIAFIWSNKDQRYLGLTVYSNEGGEFCNSTSAELSPYGTPHAFSSEERARRCLEEDTPWFNSGLDCPMRNEYRPENCRIIELRLPEGIDIST